MSSSFCLSSNRAQMLFASTIEKLTGWSEVTMNSLTYRREVFL